MKGFQFANVAESYNRGKAQRLEQIFGQAKLDAIQREAVQAAQSQAAQQNFMSRLQSSGGNLSEGDLAELSFYNPQAAKAIAENRLKTQQYGFNEQANPLRLQDLFLKPQATQARIGQSQASAASSYANAARARQGAGIDRQRFELDRQVKQLDFAIKAGKLNEQSAGQIYAALEGVEAAPEDQREAVYNQVAADLGIKNAPAYDPQKVATYKTAFGIASGRIGNKGPLSSIGKINADRKAGLISEDDAKAAIASLGGNVNINIDRQTESATPGLMDLENSRLIQDAKIGTGAIPYAATAIDRITGATGLNKIFSDKAGGGRINPQEQEAQQRIKRFDQDLVRAIINNPRFPVSEQDYIRKNFSLDLLNNPESNASKIRQLHGHLLQNTIPRLQAQINDPRVTNADRSDLVQMLLDVEGIVQNIERPAQNPQINNRSVTIVPPAAAIDYLKSNPQFAEQFNMKYGAGMAEQILGAQ